MFKWFSYIFLIFFCNLQSSSISPMSNSSNLDYWSNLGRTDVVDGIKWIAQQPLLYIPGLSLMLIYVVGKLQKENSEFFSTIIRLCELPFFVIQNGMQKIICGGKSLTWNEVASWHNRTYRLLSPFTKTIAVIDLAKEKRLRILEDDNNDQIDTTWNKQIAHINRELTFIITVLKTRLSYYQDNPQRKKKDNLIVKSAKKIMRTSLNRNEEIIFSLQEIIFYIQEIIDYYQEVKNASLLDKEHLKKMISALCATFEHLGTLVDEVSASDKNKKKIMMISDATRGMMSGIGRDDYSSVYGGGAGINGFA